MEARMERRLRHKLELVPDWSIDIPLAEDENG